MATLDRRRVALQRRQADISSYSFIKYRYEQPVVLEEYQDNKPTLQEMIGWKIKHGKLLVFSRARTFLGFRIAIATWSECYVGVSSNKFYFYRNIDDVSARADFTFELENLVVEDLGEKEGKPLAFTLNEVAGAQLILCANSQKEYVEWLHTIRNGAVAYRENLTQYFKSKATIIQRVWRGFIQVQNYRKMRKVAIYIQKIYRGFSQRKKFALTIQKIIKIQSFIRMVLAVKELERRKLEGNISKYHQKRTFIFKEIVATEESYVRDMNTTVEVFMKPLLALFDQDFENVKARADDPKPKSAGLLPRGKSDGGPMSPPTAQKFKHASSNSKDHTKIEDISKIFSNIEEILAVHKAFLVTLQEKQSQWSEQLTVAQAFIDLSIKLDVYLTYTINYDDAMTELETLKKTNQTFRDFVEFASKDVKQVRNLDIFGFLIQPIQRLPRYVLLLKDLLKNTWTEHPDRLPLSEALLRMQKATTFLNESKKKDETKRRTKSLLHKFNEPSQVKDILDSDDIVCLYEGPVVSVHYAARSTNPPENAPSQRSYLLLFTDQLILAQRNNTRKKILQGKRSATVDTVRFLNALPLPLAEISEDAVALDDKKIPYGFSVQTEQSVYKFYAKTEEVQKKWIEEINNARKNFVLFNYGISQQQQS